MIDNKESILNNLKTFLDEVSHNLSSSKNLEELESNYVKFVIGRSSPISLATVSLSSLSDQEKKERGRELNQTKASLEELYSNLKINLINQTDSASGWFDVTLPAVKPKIGRLSPDTIVLKIMNEFFTYHGYSIVEGPDIETDEYNFERTNLPKDHPARDLQDTIYIKSPEILLRTHTSSVEARILSSHKPPLRFVVPGVSFRNEVLGPSNHSIFYQYQGVVVDEGINMTNLKATLEEFAKHMYGQNVKTRFRTKYYPEVEPGAGLDILCTFCEGEGCRICKGRGWLEILGSGMIHRNILEKCGIDYNKWSGFAFGMGVDRIVMSKFNINDIRDLHGGTLVYSE